MSIGRLGSDPDPAAYYLEHVEGEVVPIAKWIAEVQRERKNLEALLGRSVPGGQLSKAEVKALVTALRDIVGVLSNAEPADKAELYAELGVNLTYHPDGRVAVEALRVGLRYVSEGGLELMPVA